MVQESLFSSLLLASSEFIHILQILKQSFPASPGPRGSFTTQASRGLPLRPATSRTSCLLYLVLTIFLFPEFTKALPCCHDTRILGRKQGIVFWARFRVRFQLEKSQPQQSITLISGEIDKIGGGAQWGMGERGQYRKKGGKKRNNSKDILHVSLYVYIQSLNEVLLLGLTSPKSLRLSNKTTHTKHEESFFQLLAKGVQETPQAAWAIAVALGRLPEVEGSLYC